MFSSFSELPSKRKMLQQKVFGVSAVLKVSESSLEMQSKVSHEVHLPHMSFVN